MSREEEARAYRRAYYQANKERIKVRGKQYRETNKELIKQRAKSYTSRTTEARRIKRERYNQQLRDRLGPEGYRALLKQRNRNSTIRRYGLTAEAWQAMLEAQGHRCACCGTDDPGSPKGWMTDHCHSTGTVRGLLCFRCNKNLGFMGDNLDELQQRYEMYRDYLKKSA
jgi:hypothetical protein